MTEKSFDEIAWEAYQRAAGTEKHKLNEAIAAIFDELHHNIKKLDHKATKSWQEWWDEVLAYIQVHFPNVANTTPKSG